MDDSDASALVQAALQHDDEAARALVRKLYPLVVKIVRSHRPRRTAEEDLCQMIFIKVFQRLSQFSGNVPLEHWVSRIAVNTCLNQIESEKVRPELRHADLTVEEQAVIENLATSTELAPDRRFASRQLVAVRFAATGRASFDCAQTGRAAGRRFAILTGTFGRRDPKNHRLERGAD